MVWSNKVLWAGIILTIVWEFFLVLYSVPAPSIIIVPIYTRMRRCVSVIYTELARDLSGKTCVGRIYPLYLAGLMECAGVGDGGVWENTCEVYRHVESDKE